MISVKKTMKTPGSDGGLSTEDLGRSPVIYKGSDEESETAWYRAHGAKLEKGPFCVAQSNGRLNS